MKQKRVSKFRSHHDSLFRAAFARPEALRSEAEVLLPPPFVHSLDFTRVNLLQTRFIDESLAHSESDATFRIAQHQREAFVYVLLEHQRKSDALMPWRLLRYMTSVWMSVLGSEPRRRKLPMLVPMVLSNVPGGWKGPRSFSEVVELEDDLRVLSSVVPEFEFVLDDLANATTDSLRQRPGPEFTRLALWLLASSSTPERIIDEAPVWTDTVERLHAEAPDDHRRAVMYLLKTVSFTAAQAKKIRKLFWMGPDTRVVTVEDIAYAGLNEERARARKAGRAQGREEGLEKGLEKGLEQGLERGLEKGRKEMLSVLRRLLVQQWKARFGKVPKSVQTKLAKAEAKQLEQWAARLVTAKSPTDVLR